MTEQPFEPPTIDLPRRAYFGAADRAHLAGNTATRAGVTSDLQSLEASRRQKLASALQSRAEDVAAAVKSLRALDATGHTEAGVSHLQAAVADLDLALENLTRDVAAAVGRIRNRRETLEVLHTADPMLGARLAPFALGVPAIANRVAAGEFRRAAPKPGPRA